tara:strand:+ start:326 stop:517 length:192 start_codon:yes stop_codon:yes gene_type:complete
MRRFDYWCNPCKNKFEEIITSDTVVRCPKCKALKVRRLMSAPMINMNALSDAKLREQFSEDNN